MDCSYVAECGHPPIQKSEEVFTLRKEYQQKSLRKIPVQAEKNVSNGG